MTKNDVMIYSVDTEMTSCRVLVPHIHPISVWCPFGLHWDPIWSPLGCLAPLD